MPHYHKPALHLPPGGSEGGFQMFQHTPVPTTGTGHAAISVRKTRPLFLLVSTFSLQPTFWWLFLWSWWLISLLCSQTMTHAPPGYAAWLPYKVDIWQLRERLCLNKSEVKVLPHTPLRPITDPLENGPFLKAVFQVFRQGPASGRGQANVMKWAHRRKWMCVLNLGFYSCCDSVLNWNCQLYQTGLWIPKLESVASSSLTAAVLKNQELFL